MKITIAQIRIKSNDFSANFAAMKRVVQQYEKLTDLIVFPELALSGDLQANFENPDVQAELINYNQQLLALSKQVGIIWGNVSVTAKQLNNTIFFAYHQKLLGQHQALSFSSCWFSNSLKNEETLLKFHGKTLQLAFLKEITPITQVSSDYLVLLGNEPWLKDQPQTLINLTTATTVVYTNMVGISNTGKTVYGYAGGSYIRKQHQLQMLNNQFLPESLLVDAHKIIKTYYYQPHALLVALTAILRYFDEEIFPYKPNWVIGVSGGLDSAVNLALLALTFGPMRTLPVTLPSRFSSTPTLNNVNHLTESLNLTLKTIQIDDLATLTQQSLSLAGFKALPPLTQENIQARLRGQLLMAVAGIENGIVLNNSNKIEIAFGYSTLYGDTIGALALLGDLTKADINELAISINQWTNQVTIPLNLLPQIEPTVWNWEVLPSAELKANQSDPMKWGYHDELVPYLFNHPLSTLLDLYLTGQFKTDVRFRYASAYGLDEPQAFIDDLNWVLKTMHQAIYKRLQFPPVVVISQTAFVTKAENQVPFHINTENEILIKKILAKEAK